MTYQPEPCYPPVGGPVRRGWAAAVAELPEPPYVLAVDGPAILAWPEVVAGLTSALSPVEVQTIDLGQHFLPWEKVLALTDSPRLPGDPDFATLTDVELSELVERPDVTIPPHGVRVVFGPGAGLVQHDVLWYVDLPKRFSEAAIVAGTGRNLGQPSGAGSTKRLFYIDWPMLDRHRDALLPRVSRWFDLQEPGLPRSIDGATIRATMQQLATRPLRTRPTFNTTPWGGHWAQEELNFNTEAPNTALGYELIAPESGVLVGDDEDRVEVPFQLIVGHCPEQLLGPAVRARFGTSFPIRFDYLDTVGGGDLSVHCHPRADYMREVFGWPYTQHETYYLMVAGDGAKVYLGLRDGVDLDAFRRSARDADERGIPFDVGQFVNVIPAVAHQLLLIPAGTPHGSGAGNVVLEVSATPYLYSLRFYDWLRSHDGRQRPVHVHHAFANLDTHRRGSAVREKLIQPVRILRAGPGWREELLGSTPEMFFEVRRSVLHEQSMTDETDGRFHVLNVVDGQGIVVETADGYRHDLNFAETMVVPAAVGRYILHPRGQAETRVVKALVAAAA